MSYKQPPEVDETGFKVRDKSTTIPNKYIIWVILLLGAGLAKDGATFFLPAKGTRELTVQSGRNNNDYFHIIEELDAINKHLEHLDNRVDALMELGAERSKP